MTVKIKILEPHEVAPCKYEWDELEVKQSEEPGGGLGVFAKVKLTPGTIIPILGKKISEAEFNRLEKSQTATHCWVFYQQQKKDNFVLNGDPALNKHGINIAMLINEPSKKKPTCLFKLNSVVVAENIKVGEELTVWYGRSYEPIREKLGYSLAGNKHLEKPYENILKIKSWPSKERRWRIVNHWLDVIDKCNSLRPKRTGARNTYHCCNKGKSICPGICPNFDYSPVTGKLYCTWCFKNEGLEEKDAIFMTADDWGRHLAKDKEEKNKKEKKKEKVDIVMKKTSIIKVLNYIKGKSSDDATVAWLKKHDFNVNGVDKVGHSSLTMAAAWGKEETVKYLLSKGAKLTHVQKNSGDNALSSAIYFGHYELASYLVGKGLAVTEEMREMDPEKTKVFELWFMNQFEEVDEPPPANGKDERVPQPTVVSLAELKKLQEEEQDIEFYRQYNFNELADFLETKNIDSLQIKRRFPFAMIEEVEPPILAAARL